MEYIVNKTFSKKFIIGQKVSVEEYEKVINQFPGVVKFFDKVESKIENRIVKNKDIKKSKKRKK